MVGEEVSRILSQHGHDVISAGRSNADIWFDAENCDFSGPLPTGLEVDAAVNTMAVFGGPGFSSIERSILINTLGAIRAARLAIDLGAQHILQISTVSVLSQKNSERFGEYAISKLYADNLLQEFCAVRGAALSVLRPTQLYCDSDYGRTRQPALYSFADQAQNGETIVLSVDKSIRRNFLHVSDFGELIRIVLESRTEGTFVCSHPESPTFIDVARAALAAFEQPESIVCLPPTVEITEQAIPAETELYEKLNFWPQIDIGEGFRRIRRHREDNA